ncbi:thermonuclease family protein [Roseomonas sp. ROY-5-3]|uniref:Thermonuclease family protein n=1 Tax=Falsiroseomonas oleicola TaxID=2801474 RepID=A0ABS6HBR6_9PROT|nr:thermonuclease family protein [Roseomonas oleicola]
MNTGLYRLANLSVQRFCAALSVLLLIAVVNPAHAQELRGRIVAISDGDTVTLLTPQRQQVRIRLHGIDAPESRQPYGTRSQQMLSRLVFGRQVRVEVVDIDRYRRTVGRIHVGRTDAGAEMVRLGGAWVYRQYTNDPVYIRFEDQARRGRRGLWSMPEAQRIPPWEWRSARRRR